MIRAELTERQSFKERSKSDIEKIQGASADHHLSTYHASGVGRKGRIMDDKISILDVDGPSTLTSSM
jgi:hypothetical protein